MKKIIVLFLIAFIAIYASKAIMDANAYNDLTLSASIDKPCSKKCKTMNDYCKTQDYSTENSLNQQNSNIDSNITTLDSDNGIINATEEEFDCHIATSATLDQQSFAKNAKSAFLIDEQSGTLIFSKNENAHLTIASMTKIMLLNLIFESIEEGNLSEEDQICVSDRASSMGGSQVFLQANKNYKASDLIKGIIVASANDASVAMAEHIFGSEEECVAVMNERAKVWGLNNTVFSNCTGLPKATQYSCAKDVAVMLKNLASHKDYFKYSGIWLDELTHPDGQKTCLTNTNKLVRFYDGCDGGKTGYTDESRFCLAATAKRGETRLICVVIGEPSSKERFSDVSEMFNYAFANFTSKIIIDGDRPLDFTIEVKSAKNKQVLIKVENGYSAFAPRKEKSNYTYSFEKSENLKAPLSEGEQVGEIIIFKDGVEISRLTVLTAENVAKKNLFDGVKDVVRNWNFTN